ncbi:MAG: peptidylprolyl isomerase [Ilumatobacteraceae bacterium]
MTRALRRPFLLSLAAAALVAGCGDNTKTATTDAPSATLAPTTDAASTTGESGCAPADGSASQQQRFDAAPPMCLQQGTAYAAVLETNHGTLHITLRADIAPLTVNNFVNLARYHYFDGTTCHRAIKNFVVQCGDPTATGTGDPGYSFADELPTEAYQIGSIAMANSGPDTNGSQFFIISGSDGAALPPNYSLFGQVDAADLPVVAGLDALANPADGPPLQRIDIVSVTITEQ